MCTWNNNYYYIIEYYLSLSLQISVWNKMMKISTNTCFRHISDTHSYESNLPVEFMENEYVIT